MKNFFFFFFKLDNRIYVIDEHFIFLGNQKVPGLRNAFFQTEVIVSPLFKSETLIPLFRMSHSTPLDLLKQGKDEHFLSIE